MGKLRNRSQGFYGSLVADLVAYSDSHVKGAGLSIDRLWSTEVNIIETCQWPKLCLYRSLLSTFMAFGHRLPHIRMLRVKAVGQLYCSMRRRGVTATLV